MVKLCNYFLLGLFTIHSLCYLQLNLVRNELRDSLKNGAVKCITKEIDKSLDEERNKNKQQQKLKKKSKKSKDEEDQDDEEDEQEIDDDKIEEKKNYREICYEKDISYSLPIYLHDKLSMISLDTTVPISWFKGTNCHLEASSKKCTSVTENMKDKISKIFKKKEKKTHHSQADYAIIEGSSQLVKGIQEIVKDFSFITRDSSRLTSLLELLLLGFYMKGEKDTVVLQSTNFINATQISQNLNYLCDGAISLRFDEMSECSFLSQLIAYQNINDKYVSIYIDRYGSGIITVGEAASKYSKNGFGGLQWMDIKADEVYGKLPVITDIIIQNEGNHMFSQIREKQYPAVISLSASYIGIPKQVMGEWLKKFNKKSSCSVNQVSKHLECKQFKQKQENKIITFEFSGKKISFELSELILGKSEGKTIFNIKQTMHDTYAVLGEPLFKKYLIVFDYNKDKVGFGEKSDANQKQFINVVSLVRFICFVFFFGCSFILCFLPIKRCFQLVKSKTKYGINPQNRGQTRRLKQYSPIQENPYEDLSGKVKEVFGEQS